MSKTDKDRPWWLIPYLENYPVRHNHTSGKCIEETLEYARDQNAGAYRAGYRHNCLKRLEYEYHCTEAEPYRRVARWSWRKGESYVDQRYECWGEYEVACWPAGSYYPRYGERFAMRTKKNGCLGPHKRWEHVDTIPCVCNGWPPVPTCDPEAYGEENGWGYGRAHRPTSMRERTHTEWHRPERRREREHARDGIKAWNATGELDDWDFVNRQARGEALWHAL